MSALAGRSLLRRAVRRCSSQVLSPALQSLRSRQRAELQTLEHRLVRLGAEDKDTPRDQGGSA